MCHLCPLNDMTAAANACKNVNPHFAYPARSAPTRLKLLRPRGGKLQHAHCTFISPAARCNERLSASPACPSLLQSSAPASAPPPPPLLWGAGAKPPSTRLRLALESAEEFMLQEGGAGCTRLKAAAAAAAAGEWAEWRQLQQRMYAIGLRSYCFWLLSNVAVRGAEIQRELPDLFFTVFQCCLRVRSVY